MIGIEMTECRVGAVRIMRLLIITRLRDAIEAQAEFEEFTCN